MEDLDYNEEEAVKFILKSLPAELKQKVTRDDIEYILDVIYDYYEEKGYLNDESEDSPELVDVDEGEMFDYIVAQVAADKKSEQLPENAVGAILEGEYEYCRSIGVFPEDDIC